MKLIFILIFSIFIISSCRKDSFKSSVSNDEIDTIIISSDSIKINPFDTNPLSAQVNYSTSKPSSTKIIIKGKNGKNSDIIYQFSNNGITHSIPIVGLYPNFENTVEIFSLDNLGRINAKSTIKIKTQSLPDYLTQNIKVDVAISNEMEPGMTLIGDLSKMNSRPQVPYIVDNYGEIRWVLDFTNHIDLNNLFFTNISKLKNGNFYFADESSSKIYEVGILGNIINTWDFKGYTFHHEVLEKPDGNFLVLVSKDGARTVEDIILEIDRKDGKIIKIWDLKESLDEFRSSLPHGLGEEDWLHSNAILYDQRDNTIIVSGRHQGVIKLTYANKVKWILSPHRGWGKNKNGVDLSKYLLTPLNIKGERIEDVNVLDGELNHPDFEWNWYQHSPVFTPIGHLLIFDNGNTRNFEFTRDNPYSRAVEYRIDDSEMTVQQVWSYGKERGKETFSTIVSSTSFLPQKSHILFCPGFQVPTEDGSGGKVIEIDYLTKKIVFQLSITNSNGWGFFRAERMNIYPESKK